MGGVKKPLASKFVSGSVQNQLSAIGRTKMHKNPPLFFGLRPQTAKAMFCVAVVAALSACTSANDTGYPDMNKPVAAANVQMTNGEAQDMGTKLEKLASLRQAGKISESEYNARVKAMRKLADDQGAK